ncbi:MAG: glycosyltransferase [Xanthomonadales bacterium]|nr:glycosyltransferase [Xanthomonadales bacterium]
MTKNPAESPGVRPADMTVVVPVHDAVEDTGRCLQSLADTLPGQAPVLVIDDASPNTATRDLLARWDAGTGPHWRFAGNPVNRGFVATVNRGIRMTRGDVVLLNSDAVTTPGWYQGLQRCLASDPDIATATPWTNNGEIASIPEFCVDNAMPPDLAAVARVIAGCETPAYPELPTAVGFCMAVSRSAIERIGPFDEALFGRGYGEENDFSMRAASEGMRNVLCDDVYVAHRGGRSFGPLGLRPDEQSMQRLLSRHPAYLDQVRAFIEADPLAERRRALLLALEGAGVAMG